MDSGVNPCAGIEPFGLVATLAPPERDDGRAHGSAAHRPGHATGAPGVAALAAPRAAEPLCAISSAAPAGRQPVLVLLADRPGSLGQPMAGNPDRRQAADAFADIAGQRL